MVVPPKHLKMIIYSRKTMVVGYNHFRKHRHIPRDLKTSCLEFAHVYTLNTKKTNDGSSAPRGFVPTALWPNRSTKKMGPLLCRGRQIFALWYWICFLDSAVTGQMIRTKRHAPMISPQYCDPTKTVTYWLVNQILKSMVFDALENTQIAGVFFPKVLKLSGWEYIIVHGKNYSKSI